MKKKNLLLNIKIRSGWSLIESIIKRSNLPQHPELWHILWFQWPPQLDLKWQMQKHRLHMIRRDDLESYEGEQHPWQWLQISCEKKLSTKLSRHHLLFLQLQLQCPQKQNENTRQQSTKCYPNWTRRSQGVVHLLRHSSKYWFSHRTTNKLYT